MRSALQSYSAPQGREASARIEVDVAGGRTVIRRQYVGYPFHVTRGFYLDSARPDLLTLYLQSASGGVYAGDRLSLDLVVGEGAALCVTTQAATVIHDGKDIGSLQQQNVTVGRGGFCAFVSDPSVLFPNADLTLRTNACVADDGVLLLVEGLSPHDPGQGDATFAAYRNALRITRPNGRTVVSDVGELQGTRSGGGLGPLGGYKATATMTIIAPPQRLPDRAALEQALTSHGCLNGTSAAPNSAGCVTRILAREGGDLTRGLEAAFQIAAAAAAGAPLARRRK